MCGICLYHFNRYNGLSLPPLPSLQSLSSSAGHPDWRAEYLKTFTDVITKERESLLAELGSEWAEGRRSGGGDAGPTVRPQDANELEVLEKKIQAMVDHHQGAMEKLVSLDR